MQYIADIGKNFIDRKEVMTDGMCLDNAKQLVLKAKESGATVAKFQTHVLQDEQDKRSRERYDWIQRNEMLTPYFGFWKPLKEYCDLIGIEFMTTPMSKSAAIKVNDFVDRWKVSSADIVDYDLIKYLKSTKKPIIISTGMSTEEQIDRVVRFLGDQIEFINYCVSLYPCPIYKINLTNLIRLGGKYDGMPVGFSDHSLSIEVPVLATRMGAYAIEKHFTLDRNAYGPDHKVSLLPEEFKQMVDNCNLAITDGNSLEEEKKHWNKFRINNN